MKLKHEHPLTFNTGCRVYTIERKSLAKDNLYGDVDFEKGIIRVHPLDNEEEYKNTLLHEIIHVGYHMFGLGDDDDLPGINNEFLTLITANFLRLFTNLNPELFDYLFKMPK